jgi:hypothetical protein
MGKENEENKNEFLELTPEQAEELIKIVAKRLLKKAVEEEGHGPEVPLIKDFKEAQKKKKDTNS